MMKIVGKMRKKENGAFPPKLVGKIPSLNCKERNEGRM